MLVINDSGEFVDVSDHDAEQRRRSVYARPSDGRGGTTVGPAKRRNFSPKVCAECGLTFRPSAHNQKYYCDSCRSAAGKRRKAGR